MPTSPFRAMLAIMVLVASILVSETCVAQPTETPEPSRSVRYSPEVVAKAEAILETAGLRRTGKSIASTETADLSRNITGLLRSQRDLHRLQQDWKAADDRLKANQNQLQLLNARIGELNLQLARIAGSSVSANNRIVGLIEATRAQIRATIIARDGLKTQSDAERTKVMAAETAYAETVLALRQDFEALHEKLSKSLQKRETQVSLQVMAANFETPSELTAEIILQSIDKRLQRIEQEIFRESIPLLVEPSGSLMITAVIGKEPVKMVVDSGASLVVLPAKTAAEIGVQVNSDAPELRLVIANGAVINARAVILPRMRIGNFEAEDVRAAVLEPEAVNAEPLLGMSFLGNFKFEINSSEKTISLLRVATP
ncbi:hypothetical protein Q31b_49690 [Novipirellula aureliae]|uniref:Retroviral aspartyl protease n=1 Tax=Novipirellula aureliae TaxID=2527966 RepID=A0A5C6DLJ7_9BACT|nr:TIGR02281 family clan AA aspartic protease [Novipirellula aureliae]TWU36687.1 hypothetical protein Q31b_49690 [Novipirellula aureliae]